MTLTLQYAVATDVGLAREINEDSVYAGPGLLAVADGMGGHAAGEVASAAAIAALTSLEAEAVDDPSAALQQAMSTANQTLRDMVSADRALHGMGTTVTAAIPHGNQLVFAHVGDSRAYLLRDGNLTQLTHDHTFVQQLIDEGQLRAEDAGLHPQRSVITRALDGREGVLPDVFTHDAKVGDRLLLCSDGLSGVVRDATLTDVLAEGSPDETARQLVDLALRAGGPDNITCIVADVVAADGDGAATPAAPTRSHPTTTISTSTVAQPSSPEGPVPPLATKPSLPLLRTAGPRERSRRIRRRRGVVVSLVTLVVLVAAGAAGWAYVRAQYYVGVQGDSVTVYRGVSGTLLGIELSDVHERTRLTVAMLPEFARNDVRDGISASSLADAKRIVDRLTRTAIETTCPDVPKVSPSPAAAPTRTPSATPPASAAPTASPTPCPVPTVAP